MYMGNKGTSKGSPSRDSAPKSGKSTSPKQASKAIEQASKAVEKATKVMMENARAIDLHKSGGFEKVTEPTPGHSHPVGFMRFSDQLEHVLQKNDPGYQASVKEAKKADRVVEKKNAKIEDKAEEILMADKDKAYEKLSDSKRVLMAELDTARDAKITSLKAGKQTAAVKEEIAALEAGRATPVHVAIGLNPDGKDDFERSRQRLIQVKEGDKVLDEFKGWPTPVKGLGSKYSKSPAKSGHVME